MSNEILQIDRLSRSFGAAKALDELTFAVHDREIFGFVGSNGAGKTTAMRIILGVLAADSGEVRSGGRPLSRADRRRIGYMPEERGLYPKMRVGEQLCYFARLRGASGPSAVKAASEWAERLGVATRLGDEVQKLSLGNQQRVQLAAALVHDPDLLVLDEPFSGLDPITADILTDVLREKAASGTSVVFSSHQLEFVERICDRVGMIRRGRMAACGSVTALRSRRSSQLRIDVPATTDVILAGLPEVTNQRREGGRLVIDLQDGADEQRILTAALAAGPVRAFTPQEPSLHDLFRDLMAYDGPLPIGEG